MAIRDVPSGFDPISCAYWGRKTDGRKLPQLEARMQAPNAQKEDRLRKDPSNRRRETATLAELRMMGIRGLMKQRAIAPRRPQQRPRAIMEVLYEKRLRRAETIKAADRSECQSKMPARREDLRLTEDRPSGTRSAVPRITKSENMESQSGQELRYTVPLTRGLHDTRGDS